MRAQAIHRLRHGIAIGAAGRLVKPAADDQLDIDATSADELAQFAELP